MVVPQPWLALALGAIVIAGVVRLARAARSAGRVRAAQSGPGTIALGRAREGTPVALHEHQLAAHGLILGASGAGKSTTLLRLLTERIAHGGPVVALDLKGSPAFAGTLAAAAAQAGRPFRLWTPDGPAHWNPLARGNPSMLKDKLIASERFTEPHYQRAAERYLQTVLTVLAALEPGSAPTLAQVVALSEPQRLATAVRRLPGPLRTSVQDYLSTLSPDQVSAVRGLATRLAIVTESHIGRFLTPPEANGGPVIDLLAALRGEAVVVFSLNSSSYGQLAAQIGTMVVQDLVAAAGERLQAGGPLPQTLVAIDEFSGLGSDHVVALFARGRESGLSVLVASQELADFARAGPGARDQILGNTAIKVVHRQDVPGSARMAAELSGTHWVWDETRHFGPTSLLGSLTPRGTRRQVERFLVSPGEVASLRTGEALLITKVPETQVQIVHVSPPAVVAPARPETTAPPPITDRASGPPALPRRLQRSAPARATPAPRRGREGPEL